MSSVVADDLVTPAGTTTTRTRGMKRLLVLFALSGTAGLVYEVVWFQLLRLTIGANSQSLGVLLACFMGGLFVGSLFYARVAPRRWHPLKVYAVLELGIAAMGVFMPTLIGWIRGSYLAHAESPQTAMLLRSVICVLLLAPPTILMGATLPALSRWVKSDERQAGLIGRLYAANIIGAVAGAFGAAFLFLPLFEIRGANLVAVGLNVLVALLAWSMTVRKPFEAPPQRVAAELASGSALTIYLAYGLNGVAALSFEVVWSRLLAMAFAATVYAFAMVLGVFLLGLGLGGAFGSFLGPRLKNPRRGFAALQLCILAAVSGTAFLVPFMAERLLSIDTGSSANALTWSLTNLVRTIVVVFPGAFLWGMSFPLALVCLGRNLGDAAKPVGRMYAFNTVGAVLGSLATSFILIPRFGSATAAAHLILIPLAAAVVLLLPRRWPSLVGLIPAVGAILIAYWTPWPSQWNDRLGYLAHRADRAPDLVYVIGIPILIGVVMALATKVKHWWSFVLAVAGAVLALSTRVPQELYMLGRHYAYEGLLRSHAEILLFEEGTMEPVVVFNSLDGSMQVSINSKICATSQPADMRTQRLLAHLPVLLSSDPSHSVVVGLGAGVTAGAVAIHDDVERVDIIELEPKVRLAAKVFAPFNHDVMGNDKVELIINDGRHYIGTSSEKFGVITSDPVDPWMAGAAALYTVEYFKQAREHLVDGGVFMQWVGMYELDVDGMRSLLAAFAEAFPEGGFWITPRDILLVSSNREMRFDVEELRRKLDTEKDVAESLAYVGLRSVEDLLGCYLCSCRSMKDFLEGAPVNRDSNLYVQFSGGFSYYEWNHPQLRALLAAQRDVHADDFIIPAGHKQDFMQALRKRWDEYNRQMQEENAALLADENVRNDAG